MSDHPTTLPAPPVTGSPLAWRLWLNRFFQNPMTMKELRARMRGRRAFVILTFYLLLMCAFVAILYAGFALGGNNRSTETAVAGKTIFTAILSIQAFLAVFLSPAFTAASITGEKERQTYDLLRTTLLSARALVTGKLISALSYILLLILAAIPMESIAFFLGGVSFVELFVSQLLMIVSAITFGLLGLFVSSLLRTTIASTVSTYAVVLLLTIGLPILVLITIPFLSVFMLPGSSSLPDWFPVVLIYLALAVGSLNLPTTLIASDVFLTQYDAIFYYTDTIDKYRVVIFSPWWIYLIAYSLLAILLFWATIRRVKQIPNI
ncbi:MAG: ABC transporter permease subunit [Chloroflexi bacterium]|nr:ABC transporter permease subunit [Chloroflexota bacterium]MBP8059988.1 ABC transporter permease subunit [Chloroflexota bacterium]